MNSSDAVKETDVLKMVKEDVLRIMGERKEKVSLEVIKAKIRVSHSFISRTIRSLKEEKLIRVENKFIRLTKKGRHEAKDIVKKHLALENYFEETRGKREGHQAAHLLEHYVSQEVISNIKKLSTLKKEGVPLTKFELNNEGIITDLMFSDYGLFERIVSMGIFLGENIMITNELPHCIVVKIKNRKFALDKNIAKEIKVVEYEES